MSDILKEIELDADESFYSARSRIREAWQEVTGTSPDAEESEMIDNAVNLRIRLMDRIPGNYKNVAIVREDDGSLSINYQL